MNALPNFEFEGNIYTLDSRLKEIRTRAFISIPLSDSQLELLEFAVKSKSKKLIKANMKELL